MQSKLSHLFLKWWFTLKRLFLHLSSLFSGSCLRCISLWIFCWSWFWKHLFFLEKYLLIRKQYQIIQYVQKQKLRKKINYWYTDTLKTIIKDCNVNKQVRFTFPFRKRQKLITLQLITRKATTEWSDNTGQKKILIIAVKKKIYRCQLFILCLAGLLSFWGRLSLNSVWNYWLRSRCLHYMAIGRLLFLENIT